jgi:hypothetical protein
MDARLEVRLVEALEAIAAEPKRANEVEPVYFPMGMAIVEKNSPEHRRAQMQSRLMGAGVLPPPPGGPHG